MRCIPHRGQRAPGTWPGWERHWPFRRTGRRNQRQRPGASAAADREVLMASLALTHDAGDGFIVGRPARLPAITRRAAVSRFGPW